MASDAVWAYRCPAIELDGSDGPRTCSVTIGTPKESRCTGRSGATGATTRALTGTWNWTDGLRSAAEALRSGRWAAFSLDDDVHILDAADACRRSAAADGAMVTVTSGLEDLQLPDVATVAGTHVHDHTRPPDEQ